MTSLELISAAPPISSTQSHVLPLCFDNRTMSSSLIVPFAICLVFVGCCTNVVFLELIVREDSGAGNIITCFQFLFIAVEGLFFVTNFMQKESKVPIRQYMFMVAFYFVLSVINNYALGFNIPMPLHMIFRAGSLMANMVLGILLLKKEYPLSKYVAVVMITVGISMATIASAQQMNSSNESAADSTEESYSFGGTSVAAVLNLCFGIGMLLTALFMSARMGIFQEVLYKKHGKHPREAMFYCHALPLPGFLLLAPSILQRVVIFTASEPVSLLGVVSLPKLWLFLLGNCITQYVCIRGVFILTTECPSLIVTLIVTLRKFLSLLFSIFYFQNPFTLQHWLAASLVFAGTALFTGLFDSVAQWVGLTERPKKE